ncbi:hypothetical protein ATZ33_08280 [Enterococcus silesiacus]|nr:Ig-like domain-containing protein [Enterococcus silesiacus]ALS01363.1 hypothetical protein ATZ33_08280 [Enterococcus silesiacus]
MRKIKIIYDQKPNQERKDYFFLVVLLKVLGIVSVFFIGSSESLALADVLETNDGLEFFDYPEQAEDDSKGLDISKRSLIPARNSLLENSQFKDFSSWNYIVYTGNNYYINRSSDKLGPKKENGFQHVLSPIFGNNQVELKALGNNSFFVYLSPSAAENRIEYARPGFNLYTNVNNLIPGHQYEVALTANTVLGIGEPIAKYSINMHDQYGNFFNVGDNDWIIVDTAPQDRNIKFTATENRMRFSLSFDIASSQSRGVAQVKISNLTFIDVTSAGTPVIDPVMDSSQIITGTGQVGDYITVKKLNGDEIGQSTVVDSSGKWALEIKKGQLKADESIVAIAVQPESDQSATSIPERIGHDPLLDFTPTPIEVKFIPNDQEPTQGTIVGTVPEESSGVNVTVMNEQNQKIGTVVTDENGHFSLVVDRDTTDIPVLITAIQEGKKESKPASAIIDKADSKLAVLQLNAPILYFGTQKISTKNETYFGVPLGILSVKDFRVKGRQTPWKLTARYTKYESQLPGKLVYKNSEAEREITDEDQLIYNATISDIEREKNLSLPWSAEKKIGFFLKVDAGMAKKGTYESSITWTVQNTPTPK